MPWFVELQKEYGPQGFEIVGVAMDDASTEDIAKFAKDMGVNYTIVLGKEIGGGQLRGTKAWLPTTYFVGRDGKLIDRNSACKAGACLWTTSNKTLSEGRRYRLGSNYEAD